MVDIFQEEILPTKEELSELMSRTFIIK